MDLSQNVVLKENYTFFVADAGGQVAGGEHGLYNRDTRFLNRYRWSFGDGVQALAEVLIDGDRELRAYRREGGRWRRAPIADEAWGAPARLDAGPTAIEFRERDRPFAASLAAKWAPSTTRNV